MARRIVSMRGSRGVRAGEVRIDRKTKWGNPFRPAPGASPGSTLPKYRRWLWERIRKGEVSLEELAGLSGKTLACWCAPNPCHGDVLSRAADWAAGELG